MTSPLPYFTSNTDRLFHGVNQFCNGINLLIKGNMFLIDAIIRPINCWGPAKDPSRTHVWQCFSSVIPHVCGFVPPMTKPVMCLAGMCQAYHGICWFKHTPGMGFNKRVSSSRHSFVHLEKSDSGFKTVWASTLTMIHETTFSRTSIHIILSLFH